MPPPQPREALDIVNRLESALVALERSFAALDMSSSPQRETGSSPDINSSPPQRGEAGRAAPAVQHDRPAPLTPDEYRRLANHLDALLEEVRQLADFLADPDADPDPSTSAKFLENHDLI